MTRSHPVARSLHDIGLATWFGGSLMGAVGVNAAAGSAGEPKERVGVANAAWTSWSPVQAAAIGAHLVGAALLTRTERRSVTLARIALTGAALGATAYARAEGKKIVDAGDPPVLDGTTPSADTPPEVADAQRRLKLLQWLVPASTGALLVLTAADGERRAGVGVLERLVPESVFEAGERAVVAGGRAAKQARQAALEARKRAIELEKRSRPLQVQARRSALELGERVSDLAERYEVADRAHDVLDRAGTTLAKTPALVGAVSEHLPIG